MSVLTKFFTFEQMDNAVVSSVSSDNSGHGAQHAIAPLEPNFAWQANEALTQHELIIDLGELKTCDTFFVTHHEIIDEIPVVLGVNLVLAVSETLAAGDYRAVTFTEHDGTVYDKTDTSQELRVYIFTAQIFRYAKITVKGRTGPNFYSTVDARFSALWFGTKHELDIGTAYPIQDAEEYLVESVALAHGKVHSTGLNVNSQTHMTRTYQVNQTQYDAIRAIMRACNGIYRPFILIELGDIRLYCHFESDEITEEIRDVEVYRIILKLIATPVVKKDQYH